jgi:hypothetical protein
VRHARRDAIIVESADDAAAGIAGGENAHRDCANLLRVEVFLQLYWRTPSEQERSVEPRVEVEI